MDEAEMAVLTFPAQGGLLGPGLQPLRFTA